METQVTEDVYMPGRGQIESQRLNRQHNFLRRVAYGHLIQPSIPRSDLRTIADVGTGTGIWAQEVAEELESSPNPIECVGFDVSPEQFRKLEISQVQFVIHDVHTPFPSQYHEKFDLVNIRLLSYAIKANSVQTVVENIVQIIREILRPFSSFSVVLTLACHLSSKDRAVSSSGRNVTSLTPGQSQRHRMRGLQLPTY